MGRMKIKINREYCMLNYWVTKFNFAEQSEASSSTCLFALHIEEDSER